MLVVKHMFDGGSEILWEVLDWDGFRMTVDGGSAQAFVFVSLGI